MARFTVIPAGPDEPVHWILRPDLQVVATPSASGTRWVIKDPLQLTYFQAPAEELAFLRLLDGQASLADINHRLQQRFPGTSFSIPGLTRFLASAIHGGLLRSTACGFGAWRHAMDERQASRRRQSRIFSLLVHRLRGIDPTPLLIALHPLVGWLFRRWAVLTGLGLTAVVGAVVASRMAQIRQELPSLVLSLMTVDNLPLLLASVVVVKLLHELGHAMTCHHHGGECHEFGILLVAFLPLLYCDVSDSWTQQNRWKRMSVAAAGIITELYLAAIFGLLWLLSVPGAVHAFFLNAMIVCSVNTLLINGNPLLRYDGYYVLSDLLQVPNLGSEARSTFLGGFHRVVFGVPYSTTSDRSLAAAIAMGTFGFCSILYRLMVIVLILWGLHHLLRSVGLEALTIVFVISAAAGQLTAATMSARSVRREATHPGRFYAGAAALLAVLAAVLLIPFPYSIDAPFVLGPGTATPVYVRVGGYLEPLVATGAAVTAGQPLARLRNPELEVQFVRAVGDLRVHEARLATLSSQRGRGPAAGFALPAAEDAVASAEVRLETLRARRDDLLITSPAAGRVLPPRNRPRPENASQPRTWSGQPLDRDNAGVWQDEQTLLCWIGAPAQFRAVLALPQHEIELIEANARVTLYAMSAPGRTLSGTVSVRRTTPAESLDRELVINRLIAANAADSRSAEDTRFRVDVALAADAADIPPLYSTGFAQVHCAPVSLAGRIWRALCHTFSFRI